MGFVSVLGLVLSLGGAMALADDPTLIVFNGKITTMDDQNTTVQAMAMKDDLILALGTNEDILKLAGPDTIRLDVKGRPVFPALWIPIGTWPTEQQLVSSSPNGRRIAP